MEAKEIKTVKTWKWVFKSRVLDIIENARCRVKAKCNSKKAKIYLKYLDRDEETYISKLKNYKWLSYFSDFDSDWVLDAYEILRLVTLDYEIDRRKLETLITITLIVKEDKIEDLKKVVRRYYSHQKIEDSEYDFYENETIKDILKAIVCAIRSFENDYMKYLIDF